MARAAFRASLLSGWTLLLCAAPLLAQSPPADWTALIPPGQYHTLAWSASEPVERPVFLYVLRAAGAAGTPRIFAAGARDLGLRARDEILAEIAARHARAIAAHEVVVEPISTPRGVAAYVVRHRDVSESARVAGDALTVYVRTPARTESGGGGGGGAGGGM
jgi:hypothetical protein